jgi:hypothetical protein
MMRGRGDMENVGSVMEIGEGGYGDRGPDT